MWLNEAFAKKNGAGVIWMEPYHIDVLEFCKDVLEFCDLKESASVKDDNVKQTRYLKDYDFSSRELKICGSLSRDLKDQHPLEKLVAVVMDQTGCTTEQATEALNKCDCDIVAAILHVSNLRQKTQG